METCCKGISDLIKIAYILYFFKIIGVYKKLQILF